MKMKIGVIRGDGIGPEIVAQAQKVLDRVCEKYGHTIDYTDILMGGCSIDACGVPLTDEAIEAAKKYGMTFENEADWSRGPSFAPRPDSSRSERPLACTQICAPPICTRNWRMPAPWPQRTGDAPLT